MKRNLMFTGALFTIVMFAAAAVFAQGMRGKGRPGAFHGYDAKTVETVSGEIVSIDTTKRVRWPGHEGTHLVVKTEKESIEVFLGPAFFLKDKITLAKGDTVEVTGSRVTYRNATGLIARLIKKGEVSVELRKEDGTPLWAGAGMRGRRR